jgi:hypothetical protein
MSSVKGTTALIRLAQNPECEVLGAMVLQPGSEKKFYEHVVGQPYDREFGERQSSRRRGTQFERNAYDGDALLLRRALARIIGKDPEDVRVRNLLDDNPGTKDDARIRRLALTRRILADQATGRDCPDIVIQPQGLLPTRPGLKPYFFVSADALVLSQATGHYMVCDLKSFVVRENEVAPTDLARVRLQLAAQHLALLHDYDHVGARLQLSAEGLLIFSKPNGLRPHEPRVEDIAGAVEAIRMAIRTFVRHRGKIEALAAGAAPYTVVGDLTPHFREGCLTSCVMAQWCRESIAGRAADLGDAAQDLLGDFELARLTDLMTGRLAPADTLEQELVVALRNIAAANGLAEVA